MTDDQALQIDVSEPADGRFVVALVGDLDLVSATDLAPRLAVLRRGPGTTVVVDVSGVTFIDSSGLKELVTGARALEADDGLMVVVGAVAHIARVFDLVRLADSVAVAETVEEALTQAADTLAAAQRKAKPPDSR